MDDPIWYKLWVISMATGTSEKCYILKSFPSFKSSLELFFNNIMHAHMLQRLLKTSVQPNTCNSFLGLIICRICRNPRPAASKDELLLRIQAIWNSFPQADIQLSLSKLSKHSSI
ncbi:uncharacterized protein TNCV_2494551 [Trichonephila clavipes]|uniref:Uncharacterized protein n=1 Tax=Trichonephila clavipes TaxID=2585209 RepID=A0A8X6RUZ6_TRICX|nr:uncharacterized protein TNCV_2494551 [Trichonephila clavipes]